MSFEQIQEHFHDTWYASTFDAGDPQIEGEPADASVACFRPGNSSFFIAYIHGNQVTETLGDSWPEVAGPLQEKFPNVPPRLRDLLQLQPALKTVKLVSARVSNPKSLSTTFSGEISISRDEIFSYSLVLVMKDGVLAHKYWYESNQRTTNP